MTEPESWHLSVCPYCGVGCGVDVGTTDGRVVAVRGMQEHPVNRGDLCALGKHLAGILDVPDRLLRPMRRRGQGFDPISWDEAASTIAARIRSTIDEHGPDAFAMYVSASEHIEEYYVYSKFVKGCLGTNNLESSARLCWASGVAGLVRAFGADAPPCAYEDLDLADLFFVAGYNPCESKPVVFRRMLRTRSRTGARMIVVDPRATSTAARADLHLRIRPGTDVALHNAIAHVLIEDDLVDEEAARRLTEDYDELREHVRNFGPSSAAEVTGLATDEIVRAARMIGEADATLFMWGQGLNQSSIGTRKVATLLNLVFITNNVGRPGAGPMAITGQSSAMGLREVGAMPHLLPGFRHVAEESDRREIAEIWGVDPDALSPHPGKPLPKLLEAVEGGEVKVLWIIHSNPGATFPDSRWARRVLEHAEFLIVQDAYHPTETTQYADILLPGAQWAEKEGTLTNSERGLNLIEQAVQPPGEARPDLEIVMDVARRMGFGARFPYQRTEEIFEEYKRCTAGRACDISGVTYERLRRDRGIQWPVPSVEHPGTVRRFVDGDFPRGKVHLDICEHREPAEIPDEAYPLTLITGLVAGQFHSGTRTKQIPALARALPEPFVQMHPGDAERAGVRDGVHVHVESRRGRVRAVARVSDRIREGSVFVPYHFGQLAGADREVDSLTHRAFDETAMQPEFKACAVRVVSL